MIGRLFRNRNPRLLIWCMALATIVGFCGYIQFQIEKEEERVRLENAETEKNRIAFDLPYRKLDETIQRLSLSSNPRKELQERFNNGKPFTIEVHPEGEMAFSYDDDTKSWITLTFNQNSLVKWDVDSGLICGNPFVMRQAHRNTKLNHPLDSIRPITTWICGGLWIGSIALALSRLSFNYVGADSAVLLSVAICELIMVDPKYGANDMLSNRLLLISPIIFAFSLILLSIRVPTPRIQFTLWTMILAIASICILFAIGTMGYVTIGLIAVGGMFYFLFSKLWQTTNDEEVSSLETTTLNKPYSSEPA